MKSSSKLLKIYICISVVAAMLLNLLPLPEWATWWRPAWAVLVIIFWSVYFPENLSMFVVWLIGLVQDVLHFSLLGEHALALIIIYYLACKMNHQLKTAPLWMQTIRVALLVLINQLIVTAIQGVIGDAKYAMLFWLPSISSLLIWPWLLLLLRDITQTYTSQVAKNF